MTTCIPLDDRPTLKELVCRLMTGVIATEFCRDHGLGAGLTAEAADTMRDLLDDREAIEMFWRNQVRKGRAR